MVGPKELVYSRSSIVLNHNLRYHVKVPIIGVFCFSTLTLPLEGNQNFETTMKTTDNYPLASRKDAPFLKIRHPSPIVNLSFSTHL